MEKFSSCQAKKFILTLGIISFAFQYTWENLQCEPFFNHAPTSFMAVEMFVAAIIDVGVTFLVYIIVALYSKSWSWVLYKWNAKQWAFILGLGLAFSISFEFFAKIFRTWSYTGFAPLIPGLEISVIPVLQFLILFPLSFSLTRYILK